jgi:threonine/homoserine/homoserine lactone efflux protein
VAGLGALVSAGVGFGLGLSLAIPPGPVNALMVREASRHGAWGGIRAGLPAPTVDTAYMLLVVFGLPRVFDVERWRVPLAAVGVLLMLYLAWDTARPRQHAAKPAPGRALAFWAVTLSNPFQYAWWLSTGTALLVPQGAWGAVGFVCAVYGWVLVFSNLVAHGAQRWPWFTPTMTLVSADLLFAFALKLGANALGLGV